jgi:hypothetical protein
MASRNGTKDATGKGRWLAQSLGKFTEEDISAGWEDLEALLDGRTPAPKEGDLFDGTHQAPEGPGWELADLKNLGVERVREFGTAFLALALWRRLGLHELLGELIEPGREEIAWADVVAVLAVGKFCGAASELGMAEECYAHTSLKDLSGIPVESVNDDRLYRALDKVGEHKDRFCAHLMDRGMVSEANITFLRERKALYIVGTPKRQ